jgi:hypothetical protein
MTLGGGGGGRPFRRLAVLDPYLARPDAGGRHEITIDAPPSLVLEVARDFDMESIALVRAIIRLRAWVLGARASPARRRGGLVAETLAMGWGRLEDVPGRYYIAGAACQPWKGDVVFRPIAPDRFAAYAEPDRVKIAWTLEAEPLDSGRTRFATETRAAATDDVARAKFRRYWRTFGIGILVIRWLVLPALRREAERRWRLARAPRTPGQGGGLTLTPKDFPHER